MPSGTNASYSSLKDFNNTVLHFAPVGVKATIQAGQTGDVDLKLADDVLITGLKFMTANATFGDTVDLQVVDVDGMVTTPNTVLNQFATGWVCSDDAQGSRDQVLIEVPYPSKIPAGLYLRLVYHSTGNSNVQVGCNYFLHKILY